MPSSTSRDCRSKWLENPGRLVTEGLAQRRQPSKILPRRSGEVEAIEVHHLGPRRHEVFHELLLGVRTRIDFGKGAQLCVRTENQVDAGPPEPTTSFVLRSRPSYTPSEPADGCHCVFMSSRLTKKSLAERLGRSRRRSAFTCRAFCAQDAQASDQNRHLGAVSVSNCARSTSNSSPDMSCLPRR